MTEPRNLSRTTSSEPARQAEEEFRTPYVDIYETDDNLILLADMPGVNQQGMEVSVEQDTLTLIGRPAAGGSDGTPVYAEYEPFSFRRVFTLSGDIRRDGIDGKIQNGVLRLTLPKGEQARVRKIPIKTS